MSFLHTPDEQESWRSLLYKRLKEQPQPLFVFNDGIIPAASMWFQMRAWTQAFRGAGLQAGDHILLALPPNRAFMAIVLAGLWEELTVALLPPSGDIADAFAVCKPQIIITTSDIAAHHPTLPCCVPTHDHLPPNPFRWDCSAHRICSPTPDIRLLLRTSGTTTAPRWVALSDVNMLSVLQSHLPVLDIVDRTDAEYTKPARVLSMLPLFHAFGLMIDMMPALFSGAEIVRDAENGRNIEHLLSLAHEHHITHCSMVPLTVQRLMKSAEGRSFLQSLQGGVIGGAPVSHEVATFLQTTRLRAGYGQTEAAPGITLGAPGAWCAGYIGEAHGCEVDTDEHGVLRFRGNNAFLGYWGKEGLHTRTTNRTDTGHIITGDYVQPSTDAVLPGYIFVGRVDDSFKLANGYFVQAAKIEAHIKQAFPLLKEVMIYTTTGEHMDILYALDSSAASSFMLNAMHCQDYGVAPHLVGTIQTIPHQNWQYTAKGSTDRKAMQQAHYRL
jgi:acyl-CoA synthetase (AMP-forming)/AMP-acid ligase II